MKRTPKIINIHFLYLLCVQTITRGTFVSWYKQISMLSSWAHRWKPPVCCGSHRIITVLVRSAVHGLVSLHNAELNCNYVNTQESTTKKAGQGMFQMAMLLCLGCWQYRLSKGVPAGKGHDFFPLETPQPEMGWTEGRKTSRKTDKDLLCDGFKVQSRGSYLQYCFALLHKASLFHWRSRISRHHLLSFSFLIAIQ